MGKRERTISSGLTSSGPEQRGTTTALRTGGVGVGGVQVRVVDGSVLSRAAVGRRTAAICFEAGHQDSAGGREWTGTRGGGGD